MKISDADAFIEIRRIEVDQIGLYCSVEAYCEGFSGKLESVFFLFENCENFIRDLENFERHRTGSVRLLNASSSSDSDPFKLRIYATDNTGHFAIETKLHRAQYLKKSSEALSLALSFDVDAGLLTSMIADFKKLLLLEPRNA
jgi:hypothetical protein